VAPCDIQQKSPGRHAQSSRLSLGTRDGLFLNPMHKCHGLSPDTSSTSDFLHGPIFRLMWSPVVSARAVRRRRQEAPEG